MNKSIRKVAIALTVLLGALFLNLNYVQVVKGNDYRDDPNNRRVLLNEYASPRGRIVVGGEDIAKSKATSDELKYLRVYPQGKLYAPVTGYYSFIYGKSGIEDDEDGILSGNDNRLFGTRLADLLTGRNPRGGSVDLTLNAAAQEAAYKNLIGSNTDKPRRGAVVAIDPTTGKILAAVSTPTFDPNQLSSHSTAVVTKAWSDLQADDQSALRNRAFTERYPPGSTFKLIVAAAALKAGISPDDKLISPNAYYPETGKTATSCPTGSTACVENFSGETCDDGKFATMAFALAKSCNTTFAALAVERLGGQKILDEAKLFGFDADTPLTTPLPVADSTVGSPNDLTLNGFLARTAFGQQDVAMTPLQGAMLSAAAANSGLLMKPYLVDKEVAPDLKTIDETQPEQLAQVLDPDQDLELQKMMEGVVTSPEGTGHPAAITDLDGVIVAGKTGTADNGPVNHPNPPHAWFTGYASLNGTPKIAVCVIIENGGVQGDETTGGEAAAPVAKAVMEAYLKDQGAK